MFFEETLQPGILKCKFDFFFDHKQTGSGPKNNLVSLIFSYDGDGPTTATTNADASFYVR